MTTAPKRRWFRFSLRTTFVAMVIAALFSAWFVRQLDAVRERANVANTGLNYATFAHHRGIRQPTQPPWVWRLLGAKSLSGWSELRLSDEHYTEEEYLRIERLFPELYITYQLGDASYSDPIERLGNSWHSTADRK
ncbi:MAG: hypothetical protein AB7O59_06955 [Pirellulales bacterium]